MTLSMNRRRYLSLSNNNTNIIAYDDSYTATGGEDYDNLVATRDEYERLRWKPQDMNDNCLTRLANTTIHCGVGGLSPITNITSSSGEVQYYCGGVPMIPNHCLLPSEGSWELVSNPSPLPNRLGIESANSTLSRCKTMKDFINGTWRGVGFSQQEYIPSLCSAIPLSPFAWTHNTKCQATIILFGDSHIRNLFTAIVYALRGIESFAEGHTDSEAKARGIALSYQWRLYHNGTASDHITVHSDVKYNDPQLFDDCPCNDEVKKCLRIAFFWSPTFQEQLHYMHHIKNWNADLVIASPGNSYESLITLSTDWASKFDLLLLEDKSLHLGILHFPYGNRQPADRVEVLEAWINNGTLANRKHAYSHKIQNAMNRETVKRKSYLPQSAMNPPNLKQGSKTFHYACSLGQSNVFDDNINAAEDCLDLIDTVHVRALTTVHYDALSR